MLGGEIVFYQYHSSLASEGLKLENGIDFSFPMHLHSDFEFIMVTEGEMEVVVDGKEYVLSQEQALLVFPNQLHELKTKEHSCHFLCIFSHNVVKAYSKIISGKVPSDNRFCPEFSDVEKLASLTYKDSIIKAKACLYSICSQFDENATYIQRNIADDDLILKIFRFVEENFGTDCSLDALSKFTSYHYVYLSKFFKKCTGISFTEYVNRFRVSEACTLLQNNSQTILKTAFDCGFDSLRSFNRNFKNIMGITPSAYQESLERKHNENIS